MNPYDTWIKSIAIGLEAMAKGIHSIAKSIYDMGATQAPEKSVKAEPEPLKTETQPSAAAEKAEPQGTDTMPAKDQGPEVNQKSETGVDKETISKQAGLKVELDKTKTEVPQKKATKKTKARGTKTIPATDKVLGVIRKSKAGVDNVTISKETGLNQKQVSSALLRLKKYSKIKSVKRGTHTAV